MGYFQIDAGQRDQDLRMFGVSYWYEDKGGDIHRLEPSGVHVYRASDPGLKDTVPIPVVRPTHPYLRAFTADIFHPLWLLVTVLIMVGLTIAYPHTVWVPLTGGLAATGVRALVSGWFELYNWAREK